MNLSEYKGYLTEAIAVEANFTADEMARRAFETLVEHIREMDMNDKYMQDACRDHGQLPDDAQCKDALRTALAEYRSYDKAEQLSTVFLIDLVHASRPQEVFVSGDGVNAELAKDLTHLPTQELQESLDTVIAV